MSSSTVKTETSPADSARRSPLAERLCIASFLNWMLFFAVSMYLHGDAMDTLPSQSGFILKSHGHSTHVTESVWLFSLFYSSATLLLTPAIWMGSAAWIHWREFWQARLRTRLMICAFLLVWATGWYSSIGSSLRRSVADWQSLKQAAPVAPAKTLPR